MHSDSVSAYSLTVTTSGSVTADVIPSADGGIGTTVVTDNVNIVSNCRAGYTMTIAGPSDNNLYLNGDDTNNASGTYFTPVNGTSALNASANANKWGYSLTANSRTGVFTALSSTAATLKTPAQTASPDSDINTTIPVYYGTSVNNNMAPGTYTFSNSNSVTYSVVMDTSCTSYSVQYQANGADNPNGMGTTDPSSGEKSVHQINIVEDTKITLLAPNFKKAGYAFLGWSTDQNAYTYFTDNDNTNDPVIYGPNEDVVIDADIIATADSRNQINMYAVWIPALKDGSNNPVYMQEWDNPNTILPHDGCSTLTATVFDNTVTDEKGKIIVAKDSVVALTDKRDNMIYTVARLADGNCWMTENLRLDNQYTMGQNQNDPTVTNQYLSQGYGDSTGYDGVGRGKFVGLADAETNNYGTTIPNSIYYSNTQGTAYINIGADEDPGRRFPRYNNINTNNMEDATVFRENYANPLNPIKTGTYYAVFSYGNYYSWTAASASTFGYFTSFGRPENAGTSICPAGWAFPSAKARNASSDYNVLSIAYGGTGNEQNGTENAGDILSNRFRTFPNSFVYSGELYTTISGRGTFGGIWARNSYSGNQFYGEGIVFTATKLFPGNGLGEDKWLAKTIRCVEYSSKVEITLDYNNGSGNVARVYGEQGSSIRLQGYDISKPGHNFSGYNDAPDGSGTSYRLNSPSGQGIGATYNIPNNSTGETIYAQFTPQYEILYVNNCMSWASSDANCTQTNSDGTYSQKINLDASGNGSDSLSPYNGFTLTGWKIKEWTTNADGTGTVYPLGSTYSVTGANPGDSITLYAHWIPVYSIQYDGNGASNPNGMGTTDSSTGVKSVKQTNVGEGDPVVLLASNFKRAGYGFAGWSTNPNATVTSGDTIYGPMETISAPAYPASGNIVTMYAVWVAAEKDGSNNPVYLQDFTASDCNALTKADFNSTTGVITPGSIIALTDKRDDEVYTIAKLADNNCWMIENLRLEHAGTVGNNKNDSSVTNQSLSQGYGGTTGTYGNFVGLAGPESANFSSSSTTANSIYKSSANPPVDTYDPANNVLEDIGTSNYPAYRFPRYNNLNNSSALSSPTFTENYANASSPSTSGTYKTSTVSSYGNYYTWAAAMANTNYYTSSSTSEAANTSICPSNWHLPSSNGTAKEYGTLSTSYGGNGSNQSGVGTGDIMSNRFRTFPNNFLYSGYFSGSSAYNRGSSGSYWSRLASSSYGSYYLYLYSTFLYPSYVLDKYVGFSVRCLIGS